MKRKESSDDIEGFCDHFVSREGFSDNRGLYRIFFFVEPGTNQRQNPRSKNNSTRRRYKHIIRFSKFAYISEQNRERSIDDL